MAFSLIPQQTEGEELAIGQSGLNKKIVNLGVGYLKPETGDEVSVHYTGTLPDGSEFDSSKERNVPLVFKLGQGEVILGLDQGIATMKKGEQAVFTIPSDLAYGKSGFPPLIPSDAELIFDVKLLSWVRIRDISHDGGILKRIVKDGDGWATPKETDEVIVKYNVSLEDGTIIAKSVDVGVQFCVRNGHICPAISRAVMTMKRSEAVSLNVKPQYGFGEKGSPGTHQHAMVPPNANLTIDLELLSWRTVEMLEDNENIVKKILKMGEGYEIPNNGSIVRVKYTAKLEDGTIFEKKGLAEAPFEFIIGSDQVVLGLDLAVLKMRKCEMASITVSPAYGFGSVETMMDLAVVPPDSILEYEVELISFTRGKELWEMNASEKLEAAARKKEEGNRLFSVGKYWRASKKYERAVEFIEQDQSFSSEEKNVGKCLRSLCYLNTAACKLKLKAFRHVIDLCSKVLELEPENLKALYRRLQAYVQIGELDLAECDITKALQIDPENKDVKLESRKLRQKVNNYEKKASEMFENLFPRTNNLEGKDLC